MARRTIVFDDLDNSTADATTISFGLDGVAYEIDLADANATELREHLAKFIANARKVGRLQVASPGPKLARPSAPVKVPTASNGKSNGSGNGTDNDAVRAWAKSKGIDVKDRGRIPGDVTKQYLAENGNGAQGATETTTPEPTPAKAPKAPRKAAGRKSAMPPPEEVLAAFKQAGSYKALAEHFNVAPETATRWVKQSQERLDPVS